MWGSSIEGDGKTKRVHKGKFFPPYTEEDVFPSSVVFILYVFCFSKGVIGGSVSPYSSDS